MHYLVVYLLTYSGHLRLSFYCEDDTIDAIPLAFLYIFFGEGGMPVIDFANVRNHLLYYIPNDELIMLFFRYRSVAQVEIISLGQTWLTAPSWLRIFSNARPRVKSLRSA